MAQQPRSTLNDPSPLDSATAANPYVRYKQLREEDPVHWNQGINSWTLTRYTDVRAALLDQRLSSEQTSAIRGRLSETAAEKIQPLIRLFSDMMVMSDPPDHTRLRMLANKAFTPRVVDRMRSHIQNVVEDLLDGIEKDRRQDGRFDVITDLAYPLPAVVISEMLGVHDEDRDQFRKWTGDLAADQLEFLLAELVRDKQLAFKWGFRPGAQRRPERAIRQVALWGDPSHHATNLVLARR